MKKMIFLFAMIFAAVLVFGCIGNGETDISREGYSLDVRPRTVVAGGITTINLRLQNNFNNEMADTEVTMSGIPRTYSYDEKHDGINIFSGQEYPIIWALDTHDTSLEERINPKIKVCFDYETDFFFDFASLPRDKSIDEVRNLQTVYAKGPISIHRTGMGITYTDSISEFIDINNNWVGSIARIDRITIGDIDGNNPEIAISGCKSDRGEIKPGLGDECNILKNPLAIGEGTLLSVKYEGIDTITEGEEPEIYRVPGEIAFRYCYNIDVGTIVICPVGQRC